MFPTNAPQPIMLKDTKEYLQAFLPKPFDEKTTFEVPAGYADILVNRVRTEFTRIKNRIKAQGRTIVKFKIRTEIERSGDPTKPDRVTFWKTLSMAGGKRIDTSALEATLLRISEEAEHGQESLKL